MMIQDPLNFCLWSQALQLREGADGMAKPLETLSLEHAGEFPLDLA